MVAPSRNTKKHQKVAGAVSEAPPPPLRTSIVIMTAAAAAERTTKGEEGENAVISQEPWRIPYEPSEKIGPCSENNILQEKHQHFMFGDGRSVVIVGYVVLFVPHPIYEPAPTQMFSSFLLHSSPPISLCSEEDGYE